MQCKRFAIILFSLALGTPALAQDAPPMPEAMPRAPEQAPPEQAPETAPPVPEQAPQPAPAGSPEASAQPPALSASVAAALVAMESGPQPAAAVTAAAQQPAPAASPEAPDPDVAPEGDAPGEVIEIVGRYVPGSAQNVGQKELERFEYNDVHQVLASVPGVYIREEDGYGLRPNIGMRGSGSERSAKIALMEDGVLIAPAPYSAPAAYYFPLVTRMERVEVLKGPAAIQYGPNTVGGAVNLISRSVPRRRQADLDIATGQNAYGKLHASVADSMKYAAFMIEGIKLRTDGFKKLDTGGSTGFDKNDIQLKLRLNNDTQSRIYHQVDLKVGYSDEVSNETYTGLADADFAAAPYRRYAATRLDRMSWQHIRAQLRHEVDISGLLRLETTLYRNTFSRDWSKLNGFAGGQPLSDILAAPTAGNNAVYYSVLTGESDSLSPAEMLVIGTNSRQFVSQGAQLIGRAERRIGPAAHNLEIGLRYHYDEAQRHHTEDSYWMMQRELVRADQPEVVAQDSVGSAGALAAYFQDKVRTGRVTTTFGVRSELVGTDWDDRKNPDNNRQNSYFMLIPGAGAVFQTLPSVDVVAGVHKGFVPVAPGQSPDIKPEESINYEAGVRFASPVASGEVIGFFSDYSNLKDMCAASRGCSEDQIGREFNGGAVHVYGVEAQAMAEVPLTQKLRMPVKASYTLNQSRFQNDLMSDNPQWGEVHAGDELPYMPAHQVSLQLGLGRATERSSWEVAVAGRYTSAMRDTAGQGETEPGERTDAVMVFDLAANYELGRWGKAYLVVDNLLDDAHIVSRRPYGARPGKPRLFTIGYKNRF